MRRLALLVACASLSVLLASGGVSAQTARAAPGLPTNLSATAVGGSLTVTWSAPTADGGATITSYDLQYTEGDATTPNPNWTVLDDVWTSGSLSYVVSGLKESTEYAVQVRAVNSDGMGAGRTPPSPRRPPTTATRAARRRQQPWATTFPERSIPGRRGLLLLYHRRHDRHRCVVVHHWRYRHSRLPLQLERGASWASLTTAATRTTT